ncbi:hypothetical protein HG530_004943 [Fusarium avenaceum]|nr:hypothetical protein HG530_004943 [Fusarium avenaceum]
MLSVKVPVLSEKMRVCLLVVHFNIRVQHKQLTNLDDFKTDIQGEWDNVVEHDDEGDDDLRWFLRFGVLVGIHANLAVLSGVDDKANCHVSVSNDTSAVDNFIRSQCNCLAVDGNTAIEVVKVGVWILDNKLGLALGNPLDRVATF